MESKNSQVAAVDGAQAAAPQEGPGIKCTRPQYAKTISLKLGDLHIVFYYICNSYESCRNTVFVVVPPHMSKTSYKKAWIELRVGEKAISLYRRRDGGKLKWNLLCAYKAESDGVYTACWSYNELTSPQEVMTAAREAWCELSQLGVENWSSVLELWLKPAGITIEDVVLSLAQGI